jgi:hypothetical protein
MPGCLVIFAEFRQGTSEAFMRFRIFAAKARCLAKVMHRFGQLALSRQQLA